MGDRGHDVNEKTDPTLNTLRLIDVTVNGLTEWFRSETHRVDERFAMFTSYMEKMGLAESKRLDAIREVDATAVRVAADRALDTAAVLATQVSAFNDQQRGLVATTADVLARNLQQVQNQIAENAAEAQRQQQLKNEAFLASIALLQKAQNESQGRSGLSIPLLLALVGVLSGIVGFIIQSFIGK